MIRKYFTPGNLFFAVLLSLVLYRPTRYAIQGYVTQLIGSPKASEEGLQLGPKHMDYEYYNLQGDTFNLLDLRGRPVFLNFWATWCGPCQAELPSIERLIEQSDTSSAILLLSNEKPAVLKRYLKEKEKEYLPVFYSPKVPVFVSSNSIPLTYVIDERGKIVIEKTGAADWDDQNIVDLLKIKQAQ